MISDHPNVLSFVTLLAPADLELDGLTFVEALVAIALDSGEVNEDVITLLTRDEAVTLFSVEELNGTCCHEYSILSAANQLIWFARK